MNFLMSYNMKVIIKLQKPFNDDSYSISFRGYSASSSPPEKHDRIAFWYTGVTCRLHRMCTQILGILSALYSA